MLSYAPAHPPVMGMTSDQPSGIYPLDSRMHAAYAPLPPYHALRAHAHAAAPTPVRSAYAPLTQHEQPTPTSPNPAQAILTRAPYDHTLV